MKVLVTRKDHEHYDQVIELESRFIDKGQYVWTAIAKGGKKTAIREGEFKEVKRQ